MLTQKKMCSDKRFDCNQLALHTESNSLMYVVTVVAIFIA